MKKFRNYSLVLLSIIFIFLASLTLVYEALHSTILKPYETANYLDKSTVYHDMEILIEDEISKKIESIDSNMDILLIFFNDIINKSITEKWISAISRDIQNTLWDYITDKDETLAVIPLIKFNDYINEMVGNEESIVNDSNSIFNTNLYIQIEGLLPEVIDINEYLNDYLHYIEKAKEYYQVINIFIIYMYLTMIFVLILVFLLTLNLRKFIRWLGINFTITSIITFIMVILFNIIDNSNIYSQVGFTDYYSYFDSSIKDLVELLVSDISINLSVYSVVMLMIGSFFIFFNNRLSKRQVKLEKFQK